MSSENDLSNQYLAMRTDVAANTATREMEDWMRSVKPMPTPPGGPGMPPRGTPPQKPEQEGSTFGNIVRGAAEIPRQVGGGIEDAVANATMWFDPVADWLNENVADLRIDRVAKPKTTAGAVARSLSEFLTGFLPASKLMKGAGVVGKVANPMAAGAIADFVTRGGHEGRLADVWKKAGLPDNVLTEYLSSSPDDSEIEGRFKNTLEGAGMGLLTEGVMRGARALRGTKALKPIADQERAMLKAKYGELGDEAFKSLGDMKQPALIPVKIDKAVKATAGVKPDDVYGAMGKVRIGDMDTYVNFARINSPDDVKAVMGQMADMHAGSISEAARGVQSHAQTAKLAESMGMSVEDLLSRRKGQPLNAEQALAARNLWASSGEKLLEFAKKAVDPNAGAVDQFNFRRMLAVHQSVQAEVIAARTETARALNSWAIPSGSGIEKARAIQVMLDGSGAEATSKELADRLLKLVQAGADPGAIARFAERSAVAKTMDAVKEVWINGLLSSPKTHIVNTTSNTAVAFQQIYERKAAEAISGFSGGGVAPGEGAAMAYGLVESTKDAFRAAAKALKTGETGSALGKIDLPRSRAVSSEALGQSGAIGRAVDFLGDAVNVPGRLLGAEDEFFKTIGYRMELHAQALRTATSEGFSGPQLATRMREIIANPPDHIKIASADAALYSTFTNQAGEFGQAVMRLRNIDSPLNPLPFILPFVRTPVNIARYAFERTPLAPLVGQWRADIAAGGARADLAMARMSTGTAIMLAALDYADSSLLTGRGPKDAGEREAMTRQGWQPYSAKIGDRYFSYNRTDPFGMTMGFAADIAESIKHGEVDQDDADEWNEVMAMSIAAVSQVSINKTYLSGMANFVEMMSDPTRYSEKYVTDLFASFLPATSLMNAVEQAADPTLREVNGIGDAVRAKIAGLSDTLPPKRNLWGEEIRSESGLGKTYDFFSPVTSRGVKRTAVDSEIERLAASQERGYAAPPERIKKKTSFGGVHANLKEWPDVYDAYTRLSGNDARHPAWNMGAKDYLTAVISGKHPMSKVYGMKSDEMKLTFINKTIADYRQIAQRQILADPQYAEFARHIGQLKMDRSMRKMPVTEGAQ